MTLKQIDDWCTERIAVPRIKDDYYDIGGKSRHVVKFENGDSYEQETEYNSNRTELYTKIKLNGIIDYAAKMEWYNFGWREVV